MQHQVFNRSIITETAGSFHVNSTDLPAPDLQTELIFGTFTDHNMIKLYMDFDWMVLSIF